MKLSELIAAYGDDVVEAQYLDQCATTLSMTKAGTRITFGTEMRLLPTGTDKLGIVVWLDRDRVKGIIEASKQEKAS